VIIALRKPFTQSCIVFFLTVILFLNTGFINLTNTHSKNPTTVSQVEISGVSSTDSPIQLNKSDLEQFLDETISIHMNEQQVAGITVSVVKDGDLLFTKGYGYADIAQYIPVLANETLFGIASISKTFTATAVMQLVENGTVDLDEDINNYLESFQVPVMSGANPITLNHLLTHTAGFEEVWESVFYSDYENLPILGEFLKNRLPARAFPPGYIQSYSNLGSALAGLIVQEVSRKPFAQFIEDYILKPLGMNSTTAFQQLSEPLMSKHSQGYSYSGDTFNLLPHYYCTVPPAGGMSATALDMAKFMIMFLNEGIYDGERILNEESVLQMQAEHFIGHPSMDGIGYGFYTRTVKNQSLVGHTGGMPTFTSVMALLPEYECGIFVAVNTDTGSYEKILTSFLDRYFPSPLIIPGDQLPITPERLSLFEGYYLPTRRPYIDLNESEISICEIIITQIIAMEDNSLFVESNYLLIDGMSFVPVDDLVFRDKSGETDIRIAFREEGPGNISFMFLSLSALTAMEKLHSWYLEVFGPQKLEFNEGKPNQDILWTVTAADWQECIYTIYCNGSEIDSGSPWYRIIVHDLDDFDAGVYNFTVVVEDVFNDKVTHTVIVNVISQAIDTSCSSSTVSLSSTSSSIPSSTPSWEFLLFILSFFIILPLRRWKRYL
jgi:CubicO group peptidase (beta-lactamase class C family)